MDIKSLVNSLLTFALDTFDGDDMKDFVDTLLDWIEDKVAETENEWDDMIVNGIVRKIRAGFDIPDND